MGSHSDSAEAPENARRPEQAERVNQAFMRKGRALSGVNQAFMHKGRAGSLLQALQTKYFKIFTHKFENLMKQFSRNYFLSDGVAENFLKY